MRSKDMTIKPLSELEQEVMDVVWKLNSCTVRDVLSAFSKTKKLAYTTIATILERLHEKGLLKKDGSTFAITFTPKITKVEYSKKIASSLFDKFFGTFGDTAMASFAQSIDELPKDKKEALLKLLLKHDKNK